MHLYVFMSGFELKLSMHYTKSFWKVEKYFEGNIIWNNLYCIIASYHLKCFHTES